MIAILPERYGVAGHPCPPSGGPCADRRSRALNGADVAEIAGPTSPAPVDDPITVQEIASLEDFLEIEADWSAAVERYDRATVYLSSLWIRCWWETFGRDAEIHCHVARDRLGVAGLVAWVRMPKGRPGLRMPLIRLPTNEDASRSDMVVLRRPERVVEALLQAIEPLSWSAIELGRIPEDSPAIRAMEARVGREFWHCALRRTYPVPVIEMESGWAGFASRKSPNFRHSLTRALRKAADLKVGAFPGDGALDTFLRDIEIVAGRSWQGGQGTSIASERLSWSFYRALLERAAATGSAFIVCLRHGDTPVSFYVALLHGTMLYALKSGYDPRYAAMSPGLVTQYRFMEMTAAIPGIRSIDMGPVASRGDWKHRWASRYETVASYYFFRRSGLGMAAAELHRIRRLVRGATALRARP